MGDNIGLTPGTLLHGAYRIERILGQGGFGITYLAYEVSLERYVAIKEFFPKDYCSREADTRQVTPGTGDNRGFVETLKSKFLREAKYIVKLDHPVSIKI
ncbi:MAG: serine/threonine protein kinase, partial [Muribaculaceae bacterium]|nr:serine/threonine protein kinase [Muribaculaceae bacterium]